MDVTDRYRHLFEYSPISFWEEDFSEVKIFIDHLRGQGVQDLRAYFNSHPEIVLHCASLVKILDVNRATLPLFKARTKDALLSGLHKVFSAESHEVFRGELIAIAEGNTIFEGEGVVNRLDGNKIRIALRWSVVPGNEETFSRVLVSIVDITEQTALKEALHTSLSAAQKLAEEYTALSAQEYLKLAKEIEERAPVETSLPQPEGESPDLTDTAQIATALISPAMEVLSLDEKMERLFPQIDVTKRPLCYRVFNNPPREKVCAYCPTIKTLRDGNVHESTTQTPMQERIMNYRIVALPVKDSDGKVIAAIELIADITERLQTQAKLEASENLYRTIFENTGTPMAVINEDKTFFMVNSEFSRITGYSKTQIEGKKPWTEVIAREDLGKVEKYHRLRRINPQAAPGNYELHFLPREGQQRDVLVTAALIPGTTRSVASFLDMTEQKRVIEKLRKREKELKEKTKALQEANVALRVSLRQRAEDKKELEEKLLYNIRELVMPYVEKLRHKVKTRDTIACLEVLEENLYGVVSPFLKKITLKHSSLTPRELRIASLIKDGKSTKDIAGLLHMSLRAIEYHRNSIRSKLDLTNKKTNLRSYLLSSL